MQKKYFKITRIIIVVGLHCCSFVHASQKCVRSPLARQTTEGSGPSVLSRAGASIFTNLSSACVGASIGKVGGENPGDRLPEYARLEDVKLNSVAAAGGAGAGSTKTGSKHADSARFAHDYDGKTDQKATFLLQTWKQLMKITGEEIPPNTSDLKVTLAVRMQVTGECDRGHYASMQMDTRPLRHVSASVGGGICKYRLDEKKVVGERVFSEMDILDRVFGKSVASEDMGMGVD